MHGAEITKTRGREKWNLPPLAVREAVINAVTHTDYSQVGAPLRIAIFDDTDRAILDTLADDRGHLTSEIAKAIGLTARATRSRLGKLVERVLIRAIGTGPKDPRRRYFRAD